MTLTVSCQHCHWTRTGDPETMLRAGHKHRETHGATRRRRARLGVCGVHTCTAPAVKRVQGRGLCPEHLQVVQDNAARRGWTTAGRRAA